MSGCDGMKTTRVVILSEHSERRIPRNLRREVEFAWALGRAPRSQVLKCVVGNPEFDDGTYRDESSEEVPHRGTIAAPRIPKLYLLLRQGSMLRGCPDTRRDNDSCGSRRLLRTRDRGVARVVVAEAGQVGAHRPVELAPADEEAGRGAVVQWMPLITTSQKGGDEVLRP